MLRVTKQLIYDNPSTYKIAGTKYTVRTKFVNKRIYDEANLRNKLKRIVKSDFIPLTGEENDNKMAEEYMCLTVGKEDYAVKKEA